jgi:7-keto-8-aminopelargonate synthetase-like enzyme
VLLFPCGFQANLAAVSVLADRLIHHSLLVGVRASGARLPRFAHKDPADLDPISAWSTSATAWPPTGSRPADRSRLRRTSGFWAAR